MICNGTRLDPRVAVTLPRLAGRIGRKRHVADARTADNLLGKIARVRGSDVVLAFIRVIETLRAR